MSGQEGNFRQIVSIKPRDQDITTSLVLTTNLGRIYQFTLDSEPYPIQQNQNPVDIPYTARVRFYYPDDGMPASMAGIGGAAGGADMLNASLQTGGSAFPLAAGVLAGDGFGGQLNSDYDVETDRGFPCAPTFVGDDGVRLIIRFPDNAEDPFCSTRFPLYAVGEEGDLQLLNYSIMGGNTYVTERMPPEARILYLTESGERREVRILSRRGMQRRGSRPLGLMLDGRFGTAVPTSTAAFRNAYGAGVDLGGSVGLRVTRAFTISVQARYGKLPTNNPFVRNAVEGALAASLAPSLTSKLRASGAIGATDRVELYSQAAGGDVQALRLSAVGRLSLAPGARVEPYVGLRAGVLRRSTSAVRIAATGLVVDEDGAGSTSAALDTQIANSFAGTRTTTGTSTSTTTRASTASTTPRATDPVYQQYVNQLSGVYGADNELPAWLLGETQPELGPEVGASFGLLVRATSAVGIFAEGEYSYSPVGTRADRSVAPFTLGLRANL